MTKTVMSVKRLATLQRFEDTLRAVMGTLVKTALTELSKHLDKYMTNAMTAQHRFSSSLLIPVKSVEVESNLTPLEFSKAITVKENTNKHHSPWLLLRSYLALVQLWKYLKWHHSLFLFFFPWNGTKHHNTHESFRLLPWRGVGSFDVFPSTTCW